VSTARPAASTRSSRQANDRCRQCRTGCYLSSAFHLRHLRIVLLFLTQGTVALAQSDEDSYSILQLDVYGSIFSTALSSNPPSGGGVYGFVERGSFDNLPEGVTRVEMPYSFTTIAIRIDKYSSSGDDQITANEFRANLAMQTLANYEQNSTAGKTLVLPLFYFSPSVKLMADEGLAKCPEAFLTTLQEAMASPATQPITDDDRALVQRFDTSFAVAKSVVAHD
jgi:hypothetical protein